MAVTVCSLASGSKGNAYLVGCDGAWLLIDDGLTYKDLIGRLVASGIAPDATARGAFPLDLRGVLITHSHSDHVKGLEPLLGHADIPIFANAATAECVIAEYRLAESSFCCFENGQPFEIGPFSVSAFSIPHDTSDPVGYRITVGGVRYFHGTDIGTPLDSIGVRLAEAEVATLESNHDPLMLRNSGRPFPLIQRIAGPRGHLANDEACELVKHFAGPKLRKLALAHLSRDCNAPALAEGEMRAALKSIGREDVELAILAQDRPGPVWTF